MADTVQIGSGEGAQTPEVAPAPVVSTEKPVENVPSEEKEASNQTAVTSAEQSVQADANGNTFQQNGACDTEWLKREQDLLKKIEDLEKVKSESSEEGFKLELKVRDDEIELLKARVKSLESELQAALASPGAGGNRSHELVETMKSQHEELLSKARGMIFDKTKMVKNQELQIEALTVQVQSLKDINAITKDLLDIRNSEVKAMEDRLLAMEARFQAEKVRHGLVLQRAQTSSNLNDDLKKEYETQLAIFKELRSKYEQRVQALVEDNERLKQSIPNTANGAS